MTGKRTLEAILSQPWAIKPEFLKTITDIAQRHGEDPKALSSRLDRKLDNARKVTMRDGVATIPITGPIFPRANLLTEISGATSLDMLSADLTAALDDDAVHSIILDIDSPGGVAFGVGEMANMIHAARGTKPIVAYAGGMAASAAYWLASAADEIVVDETAMLGSIGVVTAWAVQEGLDRDGYRDIEIVSSNAPNKRPDPTSEEGLAEITAMLDQMEGVFIGAVARNRAISVTSVVERFGRGGIKVGIGAVNAGMADRVGSYEEVLAGLAARPETTSTAAPATRHQSKDTAMSLKDVTAEQLKAERPELVAAIETAAAETARAEARADAEKTGHAAGYEAGVTAERERIAGLEANALPGYEAVLAECKEDGKSTGADLAQKIVALQKQQGSDALAAAKAGSKALADKLPASAASADGGGGEGAGGKVDPNLPVEERCKAKWDSDEAIRAEYTSLDAYTAFVRADESGRVKTLRNRAAG